MASMESLCAMAHNPMAKMLKLAQAKETGSPNMDPLHAEKKPIDSNTSVSGRVQLCQKPESRLCDVTVSEAGEERNSSGSWRKEQRWHSPYCQEPVRQDDGLRPRGENTSAEI